MFVFSLQTVLVASHFLEWRIVLCSEGGKAALNVELHGVGTEAKMTVGLLELRAALLPRPHEPLTEGIVSSQVITTFIKMFPQFGDFELVRHNSKF